MNRTKLIRLIIGVIILIPAVIFKNKLEVFYITLALFIAAYIMFGADVIWCALKNIFRGKVFDENFLMSLATCCAFAIGEFTEACGVMLFYQIGEAFQEMAVVKSKKSITALMDIRPDYANLITDSLTKKVPPDTVNIGDIILVKPGEKIPLDGIVTEGKSFLNTQALTGESLPKSTEKGSEVLSGCVNQTGVLRIKVTKTYGESTVSKIIDLVENASNKKAKTENFITTFARYYTPIVVCAAFALAVLPPFITYIASGVTDSSVWTQWLHRSLVFLVISCPCALVLSVPMSFFAGIGRAAKSGVLVKGGNYLDALNNLEIAVFDKTGTLTRGVFKVTKILPAQGFTEDGLLELAAYAEAYSNHPIAKSILNAYGKEIDKSCLSTYTELAGKGVSVVRNGLTILAGNEKQLAISNEKGEGRREKGAMSSEQLAVSSEQLSGTKVHVAILKHKKNSVASASPLLCEKEFASEREFVYAGCIIISDEIKPDSKQAIASLKTKTVMLTGDDLSIASQIADELGINEVYANLLPQDKIEKVEMLNKQKSEYGRLAFIGDGINDAPVLKMADIGIAMGGLGSDAAIEAADIVLMTDELSKIPEALNIARFTKKIVRQNIIFVLGIKAAFLFLGALGIAGLWEAIFADVGVALLAVLNAMRIVSSEQ